MLACYNRLHGRHIGVVGGVGYSFLASHSGKEPPWPISPQVHPASWDVALPSGGIYVALEAALIPIFRRRTGEAGSRPRIRLGS